MAPQSNGETSWTCKPGTGVRMQKNTNTRISMVISRCYLVRSSAVRYCPRRLPNQKRCLRMALVKLSHKKRCGPCYFKTRSWRVVSISVLATEKTWAWGWETSTIAWMHCSSPLQLLYLCQLKVTTRKKMCRKSLRQHQVKAALTSMVTMILVMR